jgi:hypothetical protein
MMMDPVRLTSTGMFSDSLLRVGVLAALLITLAVLLSGCLGTPYAPPDGSGNVFVQYQRTGGIAGFDDTLVLYENGTATVDRRSGSATFTLSTEELQGLNRQFEDARFLDLAPSYPAPTPGADYFTYTLTYRGYTVTTEDTGVPEVLTPIIQALNLLIADRCEGGSVCPLP